ncbi:MULTISPECIES: hypothetical protein [Bacillaceae]|uniref:Uncharacterized protein n=1 Tax=Evansella alkalicola TaxID=745819 RepID=A0ABS6JNE6_9BACI|nr:MULTISPECIES: hypothetical protein [Bacillaceae]MBU9720081.1 hypothetical protein [Bacillus alkalicola]
MSFRHTLAFLSIITIGIFSLFSSSVLAESGEVRDGENLLIELDDEAPEFHSFD